MTGRGAAAASWPRFAFTLVSMTAHVALGLAIAAAVFPLVTARRRRHVIRWWSSRVLEILRMRLRVIGPAPDAPLAPIVADALRIEGRGAMLVMNHVSWLDIFVVDAVRPACFVAKAEIARWPLLGYLVGSAGTIFIERGRRHAVRDVNRRLAALLSDDGLVALFPEGTTGDGEHLLPFHANLMQAALDARAPIVVAAIRYRTADEGPTHATRYVGDTTLVQSLLRIARSGPLLAELELLAGIEAEAGTSRHDLAHAAAGMIGAKVGG